MSGTGFPAAALPPLRSVIADVADGAPAPGDEPVVGRGAPPAPDDGAIGGGGGAPAPGDEILIEDFGDPVHAWTTMNDPVMGGQSRSAVKIEDGVARFDGEVAVVPFLGAPGFIQMYTNSNAAGTYPDVSGCTGLRLNLMATEPYSGYRVSFGVVHLAGSRHAYGYKADFAAPVGEYGDVLVPFADFSSKWDEATGDATVRCADDAAYCPDADALRDLRTMALWGEGTAGAVHLRVRSVRAVGCAAPAPVPGIATGGPAVADGVARASRYAEAKASMGGMDALTVGGIVGFAVLLSLAVMNRVRSRGEPYAEVGGNPPMEVV